MLLDLDGSGRGWHGLIGSGQLASYYYALNKLLRIPKIAKQIKSSDLIDLNRHHE